MSYDRYQTAVLRFANKRYIQAAADLESILASSEGDSAAVRLLLARAYFHSAQLAKAESQARILIERDPTDAYAMVLLARTLERSNRKGEAAPWWRQADALGAA